MKKAVSIVGVTGYAGAELTALLARHPSVEIRGTFAGAASEHTWLRTIHPALRNSELRSEPFSLDAVLETSPEVVFLATPNELSAAVVPELLRSDIAVIDLSGAFRLSDQNLYPTHYGFDHPAPGLLPSAVYGLTEWCNGDLFGARLVANPGCYPTAVLLALRPLRAMLDPDAPVICDAKSGVSGAGKRSELDYSFTELSGNFRAYSVGTHRHEPEIAEHGGMSRGNVIFVPHLLPVPRGILATLYLSFEREIEIDDLAAAYDEAYDDAPLVNVRPPEELPSLRDVVSTPECAIGFRLLSDRRHAVVVSVIDNLLKGAASQAVQNFNRVFGLPETEGLQ